MLTRVEYRTDVPSQGTSDGAYFYALVSSLPLATEAVTRIWREGTPEHRPEEIREVTLQTVPDPAPVQTERRRLTEEERRLMTELLGRNHRGPRVSALKRRRPRRESEDAGRPTT